MKNSSDLAILVKEKREIPRKVPGKAEKLRLKAEQLAVTAKENETIRDRLAITAKSRTTCRDCGRERRC